MTALHLPNGLLVDQEATEIPERWLGDDATVETPAPEPESAPDYQAEQSPGPEGTNDGISISTPPAVAVLAAFVVIPIRYLSLVSRKQDGVEKCPER